MAITKEELGRRLKAARENAGLTQEQVAQELGVTRGAVAQLEAGMRPPNSLQLARLAQLYGREVGDFLGTEFEETGRDALVALFRADAQLAQDEARSRAVRDCAVLLREYTSLEGLLGVDQKRVYPVRYDVPPPRTRWDAIRQGEELAELERSRLNLGGGPIREVGAVLEPQGLRLCEIPLDETISGIFLHDARHGLAVIVNAGHHPRRKVFSYTHEYCHALADRDRASVVSRTQNQNELSEVRANAFAAAFLMPADGVRSFVRALGKGEASRSVLQAFDEARRPSDEVRAVEAQKREEARAQDLQLYDVVHVAHHFGVSYEAAVYRLANLKLLSDEERQHLIAQRDLANSLRSYLEPEPEEARHPREFRHQLLLLALEAYRREEISRGRLRELCFLAEVPEAQMHELIAAVEAGSAGPAEGKAERKRGALHVPKGR